MRDRTRYLYLAVIVAVVAGIAIGLIWPDVGKELKPLGAGFVALIKMMGSGAINGELLLNVTVMRDALARVAVS
ncbi:hypothetical protein [Nonomuraea endophytica]|uniref:hypothetical protein n=1 Tax=Nonomuraea endophytica TaxID=714136 RepID=UPI0037C6A271